MKKLAVMLMFWGLGLGVSAKDPGGYPGFLKAEFKGCTFDTTSDALMCARYRVLEPEALYASSLDEFTTVAYIGYMRMDGGRCYHFKGCYDDRVMVRIGSELVLESRADLEEASGSFTPRRTDWYKIELRVGDNQQGGGCCGRSQYGIMWKSDSDDYWHRFDGDGERFKTGITERRLEGDWRPRTIPEMEQEIVALRNEAVQLQKRPIVIYGSKQENLSDRQKRTTSAYNMNIAQSKERGKYKSKVVITINPIYACPLHKCFIIDGRCEVAGRGCKAIHKIGTMNFNNRGEDWDLSYRCWTALRDEIPVGVAQERRLREIDAEIAEIKDEIKAALRSQRSRVAEDGREARQPSGKGKKMNEK